MSEERVLEGLDKQVNNAMVALASKIHTELVKGTPVDTGWARANWVPGIGVPPQTKGQGKGDVAAATAKAQKGLITVKAEYDYTGEEDIYLSNNVPYVPILDAKHRTKAGFISRAIDNALTRFAG